MAVTTLGPWTKNSGTYEDVNWNGYGRTVTAVRVRWTGVSTQYTQQGYTTYDYGSNSGSQVTAVTPYPYNSGSYATVNVPVPNPSQGTCESISISVTVKNEGSANSSCSTNFSDPIRYVDPGESVSFTLHPSCSSCGSTVQLWVSNWSNGMPWRITAKATVNWKVSTWHPPVTYTYNTQNPKAVCNGITTQYNNVLANGAKTEWIAVNKNFINGNANNRITFTISGSGKAAFEVEITWLPPPPVANFEGAPTTGTVPMTVQFTDQSTGTVSSYYWSFGDGAHSTLQNPSHTYNSEGTFSVSLKVTNAGGDNTKTRTNYITADILRPTPIGYLKVRGNGETYLIPIAAINDPVLYCNHLRVWISEETKGSVDLVTTSHSEASPLRIRTSMGTLAPRKSE